MSEIRPLYSSAITSYSHLFDSLSFDLFTMTGIFLIYYFLKRLKCVCLSLSFLCFVSIFHCHNFLIHLPLPPLPNFILSPSIILSLSPSPFACSFTFLTLPSLQNPITLFHLSTTLFSALSFHSLPFRSCWLFQSHQSLCFSVSHIIFIHAVMKQISIMETIVMDYDYKTWEIQLVPAANNPGNNGVTTLK